MLRFRIDEKFWNKINYLFNFEDGVKILIDFFNQIEYFELFLVPGWHIVDTHHEQCQQT